MVENPKRKNGIRSGRPLLGTILPEGGEIYESTSVAHIAAIDALSLEGLPVSVFYELYRTTSRGRTDYGRFEEVLRRKLSHYDYQLRHEDGFVSLVYSPSLAVQGMNKAINPCYVRDDLTCQGLGCLDAPKRDNPQKDLVINEKSGDKLFLDITRSVLSILAFDSQNSGLAQLSRNPWALVKDNMPDKKCYKMLLSAGSIEELGELIIKSVSSEAKKYIPEAMEDEKTFWQRITTGTQYDKSIFASVMKLREKGILNLQDIEDSLRWHFSGKGEEEAPKCAARYTDFGLRNRGKETPHRNGPKDEAKLAEY